MCRDRIRIRWRLGAVMALGIGAGGGACSSGGSRPEGPAAVGIDTSSLRTTMSVLADDSLEGRFTGGPGASQAASYIAGELERLGLQPAGDSGFFQRVPIHVTRRQDGRERFDAYPSMRAWDMLPPEQQLLAVNVVALLPGSDTTSDETVVVGAHYDHLGIRRPINGDSIYNGADDASGAVAVLEIARQLAGGPELKRGVVFLFTAGEAIGFIGTRYYAENPVRPLRRTVAALWIENIGRPDPFIDYGKAWITGSDRTDLGQLLDEAEIDVEPDPRPELNIYSATESVVLAQYSVPAHALSSFSFHDDWHQPSDEIEQIDFVHMAQVTATAVQVVRYLATGVPPGWYPGARPARTF